MTESCVFCAIIAREAPAADLFDYGDTVQFTPLNPVTEGHTLIVPKEHVTDAVVSPSITARAMCTAAIVAGQFASSNIITSIGADATQTVFHLHIHVVPRRPGDGLTLPWTGQERNPA